MFQISAFVFKILRPLRILVLWIINFLIRPHILGYWSDNYGAAFCISNKEKTHYRFLGSESWSKWSNVGTDHNAYLRFADADMISLHNMWNIISKEAFHREF